ncbi:hypothetical protein G6O69_18390 [Pseudenhygromyxa sp. WMMC2535]|uniref:hypothetical protein n=1 Tax=Pseudenhygromyxa sp. WMMC2535 TaxID=2712867 RepID=UPI001553B0D9|nr:hypothetical protein [Pseudenhygromyxa sp. WMMC2535]NVB39818.1 hypothetical protein [Pseudenhygromyxa sp. WMMC2535]
MTSPALIKVLVALIATSGVLQISLDDNILGDYEEVEFVDDDLPVRMEVDDFVDGRGLWIMTALQINEDTQVVETWPRFVDGSYFVFDKVTTIQTYTLRLEADNSSESTVKLIKIVLHPKP